MKRKKSAARQSSQLARPQVIFYSIAAALCLAGLVDATYLTVEALTGETVSCGGSRGCSEVLGSAYSHIGIVPVAAFGIVGYFSAFCSATFAGFGYSRAAKLFAITVGLMLLATLWFLYVQMFVLHSYCRYCLFSAAMTFLLAAIVVAAPASVRSQAR